jgi:hypothetical protein
MPRSLDSGLLESIASPKVEKQIAVISFDVQIVLPVARD